MDDSPSGGASPALMAAVADPGLVLPVPVPLSSRPGYSGPWDGVSNLAGLVRRAEFEVEHHAEEPYVRVYVVVSNRQNLHRVNVDSGWAGAHLADVQMDPGSGRIVFAMGSGGRPLTVIGGRPLVTLKLVGAMTDYQRGLRLRQVMTWRRWCGRSCCR